MMTHQSQYGFVHTGILALLLGVAITICCCASSTTAAELTTTSQQVVTLDVQNMTCATCPIAVRMSLTRLDGVDKADVSYEHKTATVTFNPQNVTTDQLTQATTNAGYPSTVKTP
jgi:periplasmic mercuric ion binding protein